MRCRSLLSLLALSLLLTSCGEKEKETEELIRPVRYIQVFATGGARVRTFSGTARSGMESDLSFKIPGTITRLPVNVGDSVRRGSELARLDDNDYRLQVQEAEAALAQSEAQQRNAQSGYDRVRGLYENRNASRQDLDAARASFESASAQVNSIGKRLELARLQLSYTSLLAPFDGKVAAVRAEVNENVGAGTPIVVLTAGGRPEVCISIPEVLIAQVKQGSKAAVTFDALPGQTIGASVTEVGVTSTGFVTTFPVTVLLDESNDDVKPGMAAEVAFRFETMGMDERIIIPPVAVGEDRQGRFVFLVEPGEDGFGTARRTAVRIGDLTSDGLVILEGIGEGDLVITAGVSRITDGQRVKLL